MPMAMSKAWLACLTRRTCVMNKLKQISYGVETDPVILAIIPEIAHAMCGESDPGKMTAGQKRKARNIALNVKKSLIRAGIVRDGQIY